MAAHRASDAKFSLLPPGNATGNFAKVVQRVPVRIALLPGPLARLLRPGPSVMGPVDKNAQPAANAGADNPSTVGAAQAAAAASSAARRR